MNPTWIRSCDICHVSFLSLYSPTDKEVVCCKHCDLSSITEKKIELLQKIDSPTVKHWKGLEKPELKRSNYYSISWRYVVDPTFTDSQIKNLDKWHEMQWRLDRGEDVVDIKRKSSFVSLKDVAQKAPRRKRKRSAWKRLKQLEDTNKINIKRITTTENQTDALFKRITTLENQMEVLISEQSFIVANGGQV